MHSGPPPASKRDRPGGGGRFPDDLFRGSVWPVASPLTLDPPISIAKIAVGSFCPRDGSSPCVRTSAVSAVLTARPVRASGQTASRRPPASAPGVAGRAPRSSDAAWYLACLAAVCHGLQ